MQRACLPTADYKTTTMPPSSSSSTRQHHARVAGPRCAMASFFGACDRPPDHTTTQNTAAVGVIRTTGSSNKEAVQRACFPQLTTHYYGSRTAAVEVVAVRGTGAFYGIIRCVCWLLVQSDVGALFFR